MRRDNYLSIEASSCLGKHACQPARLWGVEESFGLIDEQYWLGTAFRSEKSANKAANTVPRFVELWELSEALRHILLRRGRLPGLVGDRRPGEARHDPRPASL